MLIISFITTKVQKRASMTPIWLHGTRCRQNDRISYLQLDSIERISKRYGYSISKVTSMLYRIRGKFRKFFVMKAIVLQMQDSFIEAHKL